MRLTALLLLLVGTARGAFFTQPTLWDLFPVGSSWRNIIMSLRDNTQVNLYLSNYILPFKQLQTACRNDAISEDVIRSSVISLIQYYQDALDRFIVSEDTFTRLTKATISTAAGHISRTLSADPAFSQRLGPIWPRDAAIMWLQQRLEDMVFGPDSYIEYQSDRGQFKYALDRWLTYIRIASGSQMRHLVRTTEDITEVQRRLVRYLLDFRKSADGITPLAQNNAFWQIRMLGNSASGPQRVRWTRMANLWIPVLLSLALTL